MDDMHIERLLCYQRHCSCALKLCKISISRATIPNTLSRLSYNIVYVYYKRVLTSFFRAQLRMTTTSERWIYDLLLFMSKVGYLHSTLVYFDLIVHVRGTTLFIRLRLCCQAARKHMHKLHSAAPNVFSSFLTSTQFSVRRATLFTEEILTKVDFVSCAVVRTIPRTDWGMWVRFAVRLFMYNHGSKQRVFS